VLGRLAEQLFQGRLRPALAELPRQLFALGHIPGGLVANRFRFAHWLTPMPHEFDKLFWGGQLD